MNGLAAAVTIVGACLPYAGDSTPSTVSAAVLVTPVIDAITRQCDVSSLAVESASALRTDELPVLTATEVVSSNPSAECSCL